MRTLNTNFSVRAKRGQNCDNFTVWVLTKIQTTVRTLDVIIMFGQPKKPCCFKFNFHKRKVRSTSEVGSAATNEATADAARSPSNAAKEKIDLILGKKKKKQSTCLSQRADESCCQREQISSREKFHMWFRQHCW